MKQENVNHPQHYNSHPKGIECIDIIRHYTCDIANAIKYLWRAGLKPEMGKDNAEKEIEDLHKALWYIEDYRKNAAGLLAHQAAMKAGVEHPATALLRKTSGTRVTKLTVRDVTGYTVSQIVSPYCEPIRKALGCLLLIGIIRDGHVFVCEDWQQRLEWAVEDIQSRILDINAQLIHNDCNDIKTMMAGYMVEGMHTAKPSGKRDTEPDDYDPLNIIIIQGTAYCLTDEVRKKQNGALYGPCDNCALSEYCVSNDGTESLKNLCNLHFATDQQYYREVGYCKYRPHYGTIEVVVAQKEMEKELKEMDGEG